MRSPEILYSNAHYPAKTGTHSEGGYEYACWEFDAKCHNRQRAFHKQCDANGLNEGPGLGDRIAWTQALMPVVVRATFRKQVVY